MKKRNIKKWLSADPKYPQTNLSRYQSAIADVFAAGEAISKAHFALAHINSEAECFTDAEMSMVASAQKRMAALVDKMNQAQFVAVSSDIVGEDEAEELYDHAKDVLSEAMAEATVSNLEYAVKTEQSQIEIQREMQKNMLAKREAYNEAYNERNSLGYQYDKGGYGVTEADLNHALEVEESTRKKAIEAQNQYEAMFSIDKSFGRIEVTNDTV